MRKIGKNRKLFQGIGIGYVVCLITHVIAALLPVYAIIPFINNLGEHSHHSHGGVMEHIFTDILILTSVIVPVVLLTYIGHRVVRHIKCKYGDVHEVNHCDECQHRTF